jgi:hypothetical protein
MAFAFRDVPRKQIRKLKVQVRLHLQEDLSIDLQELFSTCGFNYKFLAGAVVRSASDVPVAHHQRGEQQ